MPGRESRGPCGWAPVPPRPAPPSTPSVRDVLNRTIRKLESNHPEMTASSNSTSAPRKRRSAIDW